MPQTVSQITQLRREWHRAAERARVLGLRHRTHPTTPVIPWYQNQIAILQAQFARLDGLAITAPSIDAIRLMTFGIEIECILPDGRPRHWLLQKITDAGFNAVLLGYSQRAQASQWKLTTDQTIGYTRGVEIISPILQGDAGFADMRKMLELVEGLGCTVNHKCGFHVHIGAIDRELGWWKDLLKFYAFYEPVLDELVAPSRRGSANRWCQSTKLLVDRNIAAIEGAQDLPNVAMAYCRRDRYRKLNMEAFWRHTTVEFRHHQGTVNVKKAEHWVRLCMHMVDAVARGVQPGEATLAGLIDKLGLTAADHDFYQRRRQTLAGIRRAERS